MAGIYLHIPFCKKACHYCDFHFSTSLQNKERVLSAMHKELRIRKMYLPDSIIDTVYFGGGTPSILDIGELDGLLNSIRQEYELVSTAEITLEANPDDLSTEKLQALYRIGINRLSIGVQSFNAANLNWMNRSHSAEQAVAAIRQAKEVGFSNYSIDLIYGIPDLSDHDWRNNLQVVLSLDVPHISAYCLTVEKGTALGNWVKTKKILPMDEAQGASQFEVLIQTLKKAGYEQYEISNFCKPGLYSKHNSSYWKNAAYLGVGPSAHSYNGVDRGWNVANNVRYCKALEEDRLPFEEETLTNEERYNDFVMTSLRTVWGTSLAELELRFGAELQAYCLREASGYMQDGFIQCRENTLYLTEKGKLIADRIASDLFKL